MFGATLLSRRELQFLPAEAEVMTITLFIDIKQRTLRLQEEDSMLREIGKFRGLRLVACPSPLVRFHNGQVGVF